MFKAVSHLEDIADCRANAMQTGNSAEPVLAPEELLIPADWSDADQGNNQFQPVEYTRTLDKGYRFFVDSHVLKDHIEHHHFPLSPEHSCVRAKVLPSMRKDRVYDVMVVFHDASARVILAFCVCPAGLSGCCNHVTATLYCMEDLVKRGLREEAASGRTEKLRTWNQPRQRKINPRPTEQVVIEMKQYGVKKRKKLQHIHRWDCRPVDQRITNPNKVRQYRQRLQSMLEGKLQELDETLMDVIDEEKKSSSTKKAAQQRSELRRYGSSCFLHLLDEESCPLTPREEVLRTDRKERAAAKKKEFHQVLSSRRKIIAHDHTRLITPDKSS